MAKYLVIVESPAKVKTIKKFLGSNYEVMASNGHVRDLPKSQLGIDVENDYEPKYITIRGKGDILAGLRKAAKKADKVYLATDPDREGEAISWHLSKALKLDEKKMREATSYLIGRHDFASFCGAGAQVKSTVRTIRSVEVERFGDMVTIRISGEGFLYNMVRIIAGTLIEIGNGQYPPERMQEILDARDREWAGPTAPAKGLTLLGIQYE